MLERACARSTVLAAVLSLCVAPIGAQERGPAAAASRPLVAFADGRLTVNARSARLIDVLDQVSTQTRVALVAAGDLERERISVAFEAVPLVEALQRLLQPYDSFMYFGVASGGTATVRVVWVYPRGKGAGIAPVPASEWASTGELLQVLANSTDPAARAGAVEALIGRGGSTAADVVRWALGDEHEAVRSRALSAASTEGVAVPSDVLYQALGDASRDVRFLALQGLGASPDA